MKLNMFEKIKQIGKDLEDQTIIRITICKTENYVGFKYGRKLIFTLPYDLLYIGIHYGMGKNPQKLFLKMTTGMADKIRQIGKDLEGQIITICKTKNYIGFKYGKDLIATLPYDLLYIGIHYGMNGYPVRIPIVPAGKI